MVRLGSDWIEGVTLAPWMGVSQSVVKRVDSFMLVEMSIVCYLFVGMNFMQWCNLQCDSVELANNDG